MKCGSLFSGIGGLDLGLERAGMEVVWQVEIDPFRRKVLAYHWPDVERFEDVRDCRHGEEPPAAGEQQFGSVDLICGGFPCQDLSVAGRRAGLHGSRSGLFFEFARIVGEILPEWILVENVPGLLSSNGGDDFRIVIDTFQGLGYGLSWRILDSRYFGVPQRRRRVYIVGSLGDLRSAAVLFEPEGGTGDSAAGRKAGEGIAHALTARTTATGRLDPNGEDFIPEVANARRAGHRGTDDIDRTTIISTPADPDGMRETPGVPRRVDVQPQAISDGGGKPGQGYPAILAAPLEAADGHHGRSSPRGDGADNLVASSLRSRSASEGVNPPGRGGEDDDNLVAAGPALDVKPCCPDGSRYAALGDAVTVNVAEWIGRRIIGCHE